MIGNFHFLLGKALFGTWLKMMSPKIMTSNKMANSVWKVNERCSVFHHLLAKLRITLTVRSIGMTKNKVC